MVGGGVGSATSVTVAGVVSGVNGGTVIDGNGGGISPSGVWTGTVPGAEAGLGSGLGGGAVNGEGLGSGVGGGASGEGVGVGSGVGVGVGVGSGVGVGVGSGVGVGVGSGVGVGVGDGVGLGVGEGGGLPPELSTTVNWADPITEKYSADTFVVPPLMLCVKPVLFTVATVGSLTDQIVAGLLVTSRVVESL